MPTNTSEGPTPPSHAARRVPTSGPGSAGTLFLVGGSALWVYLCFALLYGTTLGTVTFGAPLTGVAVVAGVGVVAWMSLRVDQIGAPLLTNVGLLCLTSAVLLLVGDVGYAMVRNAQADGVVPAMAPAAREEDPVLWHGELFPRRYYPTSRRFFVYKPGTEVRAQTYGEFYHPDMMAFPLLVDSVLELKTLTYRIGPLGLRDATPLGDARLFALGDSYAMGYGADEGESWTDLLEAELGEPVYNLGVSSTGPRQQLMLLRHLLAENADSMHVGRVIWMLFEGNDLENSYAEGRPPSVPPASVGLFDGTFVDLLGSLPATVRDGSVLRRLARTATTRRTPRFDQGGVTLEGFRSPYPLYHSERFGYRLFNPLDVERATLDRTYVMDHPNRPLLERTLRDMAELASGRGFEVTVVIAPTAARMHGAAFDGFPKMAEPYFARFAAEAAREAGFDVLDLVDAMRPAAERELLYQRDDHHWNRRGHEVAAGLIADALQG